MLSTSPLLLENTMDNGRDAEEAPAMEPGAIRTIQIGGCTVVFTVTYIISPIQTIIIKK
jgi:hypothetical protein